MRLFVAVELPETVRSRLATGIERLEGVLPKARWVRPRNLHLTLKFMGEQPESFVEALSEPLSEALAALRPVTVRLDGGGFFPSAKRPRVAWLGGTGDGLEGWARVVEDCAGRLGLERERRPFSTHLTLARVTLPWGGDAADLFLGEVDRWHLPEFEAGEAVLFRSELQPAGAVHTPVRRWRVGGPRP